MKKQTLSNLPVKNTAQSSQHRKNTDKKISGYVYTEADLGEGILDVGVSTSYTSAQLKKVHLVDNYHSRYIFF